MAWNACALTLRLALEELAEALPEAARPACWPLLWDRYVESKVDYRSRAEALRDKFRQAGVDGFGLLQGLECLKSHLRYGTQMELLAEVLGQRFALKVICRRKCGRGFWLVSVVSWPCQVGFEFQG